MAWNKIPIFKHFFFWENSLRVRFHCVQEYVSMVVKPSKNWLVQSDKRKSIKESVIYKAFKIFIGITYTLNKVFIIWHIWTYHIFVASIKNWKSYVACFSIVMIESYCDHHHHEHCLMHQCMTMSPEPKWNLELSNYSVISSARYGLGPGGCL